MIEEDAAPVEIVIRKFRRRPHKPHGGAWKVAYADFVTAMMALFIVLWVLNQGQAVQRAITKYFRDPGGQAATSTSAISGEGTSAVSGAVASESDWQKLERSRFEETGKRLLAELAKTPEFSGLMNQIRIEIVREGLRIEIVESVNDVFFDVGNTELKPTAIRLLENIGSRLKALPNKIVVEGHTDARPYPGSLPDYTNFELSADRANSARRALTRGGLPESQIDEVRGYAASRLRDLKDPLGAVNRRISMTVKYTTEP